MKIVGNTVGTTMPKPNLMQTDPKKGDYVKGKEEFAEQVGGGKEVDLSGYATEQYVQNYAQPKGNYLTEHQDISGKLDASALPTAINTALAQAKASGEFDGKDYALTEADKQEIAELTAELVDVPTDAHINSLINTALGVIENGTY